MTVIIRLQNLPWTANALDIRRFFQGLTIPDGGVHIVGGDKGDAFIAFSTDDDARQAMYMDAKSLCDKPIKLLLSSKTEMQNVIAIARGAVPAAAGRPAMTPAQDSFGHLNKPAGVPLVGAGQPRPGVAAMAEPRRGMAGNDFQPFDRGMGRGMERSRPHDLGGRELDRMSAHSDGHRSERVDPEQDWDRGGMDRVGPGMRGHGERFGRPNDAPNNRMNHGRQERGDNYDRSEFPPQGDRGFGFDGGRGEREYSSERSNRSRNTGENDRMRNVPQYDDESEFREEIRGSGDEGYNNQQREFISNRDMPSQSSYDSDQYDRHQGPHDDHRHGSHDDRHQGSHDDRHQGPHDDRHQGPQDDRHQGPHDDHRRDDDDWGRSGEEPRYADDFQERRSSRNDNYDYDNDSQGRYSGGEDYRDRFDNSQDFNDQRGDYDRAEGYVRDEWDNQQPHPDDMYDERPMDFDDDVEMQPVEEFEDNRFQNNDGGWENRSRGRGRGRGRGRFMGRGRGRGAFSGRSRGSGRGSFQSRGGGRRHGNQAQVYVYMSHMPDTVSYKDVRRFFSGCEIPGEGLKLINDKYGNRNGTAYVMFAREVNCHHALKRSGQTMGNKRITIERCNQDEFERAVDSYVPQGGPEQRGRSPSAKRRRSRSPISRAKADGSNCIVITNVHFRATRLDIRQFLGTCKLHTSGGPHIQLGADGRPTGTAFVQLDGTKDFEEALNQNKRYFLHRPVNIAPITKSEFDKQTSDAPSKEKQPESKDGSKDKDEKKEPENSSNDNETKYFCVKMRGVPFSTTINSIKEFFSGLEISHRGIHLITNAQGQASGLAFVEFVTSGDCKKALEKNKQYMGKRYIEITPITKLEMIEEKSHASNPGQGRAPIKRVPEIPGISRPGCTITMSNLPYTVQLEDIMTFLGSCRPIQDSVRLRYSKDGKPTGDAMVAFRGAHDAQKAIREFNRKVMNGRAVVLEIAK